MATLSAKVYEHHKKIDGTYNVKIIVYHKEERRFIDNCHYVSKRQLNANFEIKGKYLLKILDNTLDDYRTTISELSGKLNSYSCEKLRDHLRDKDSDIDFVSFCADHIKKLREMTGRDSNNHRGVMNSLIDYFGREIVSINEITSSMLLSWERYLKTDRVHVRVGNQG